MAVVGVVGTVCAAFGRDLDHTCRTVTILRGQGTGEQLQALDHVRIERLAEFADAFRQDDAVDAVLQIGMIAAHVDRAERILHDAGRLQQHLIERRRIAERQLLDRFLVDHVLARANAGRELVARLVEARIDLDGLERGSIARGLSRGGRAIRARDRVRCVNLWRARKDQDDGEREAIPFLSLKTPKLQ